MNVEEKISKGLSNTGFIEVVEIDSTDNMVTSLFRVLPGKEKVWLEKLEELLIAGRRSREGDSTAGWGEHVCRRYFLKGSKLVWGWSLAIQSDYLDKSTTLIYTILTGDPSLSYTIPEGREIMEMPLLGAATDRNAPIEGSSKGAFTTGEFKHPASRR